MGRPYVWFLTNTTEDRIRPLSAILSETSPFSSRPPQSPASYMSTTLWRLRTGVGLRVQKSEGPGASLNPGGTLMV